MFHGSTPFTADDVIHSCERIADPANAGLPGLPFGLGLTNRSRSCRIVRSSTLSLKAQDYVRAARTPS